MMQNDLVGHCRSRSLAMAATLASLLILPGCGGPEPATEPEDIERNRQEFIQQMQEERQGK